MQSHLEKNLLDFKHMVINVVRPEAWEDLNNKVRLQLSLSEKVRSRIYHGMPHAVFEIAQGTTQFMSHKKSVAFVTGQSPLAESLLPYYLKETYQVQKISYADLQDPKAWVDSLNKDTAFVFFGEDHPVTAERFSFAEELDRLLNEKRIYSFKLSYSQHFFNPQETRPYTVRFCAFGQDICVAMCGERFRTPAMMAPSMYWNEEDILAQIENMRETKIENAEVVRAIESYSPPGSKKYFLQETSRSWDRAVLVFTDVSADAIAQSVKQKLKFTETEFARHVGTTNLCTWRALNLFSSWWRPGPTPEELRGMLVISTELLQHKDINQHLSAACSELKLVQTWSV